MKRNHIGLIEMFGNGKWMPIGTGAYLTRAGARRWKKEGWEKDMPNTLFRIKKYEIVSEN